jgi:hypothetical protein
MTNVPKIALSTFADGNVGIRAAGRRLINEATHSNLFQCGVFLENLESVFIADPEFKRRNHDFIVSQKRGLGNYIWKPQVLINSFARVKDNEFICYLDSGCQLNLNPNSVKRFAEYFDMADVFGGLFMQLENGALGAPDLSDEAWTNKITLDLLDPKRELRKSGQIQSGILLLKKTSLTTDLVDEWMKKCEAQNYLYLMEDPANPIPGRHRWEQSILSLLVKNSGMKFISDETFWAPNWSQGINYPIWAMRNRSGGNAYRRNIIDLSKIGIAKLARL